MKSLINRRTYRDATQANLALFAENVLMRTKGVAEFAFMANAVEALEGPLSQYSRALARAQNRGRAEISAKNDARELLKAALNAIADQLENHPDIGDTLILEAGFETTGNNRNTALAPSAPKVLKALTTGKKGELRIVLSSDMLSGTRYFHACEYSEDQGQTWQNGVYRPSRSFVLQDLPSSNQLLLRFRTIGPGGRVSNWSEPSSAVVG
jgi:hypothetical protein